jgi:hypothetical protein
MPKQPHNEHELELALTRLAGSNLGAVKYRDMMSGVILGQMLPSGTVVKGGSSLRLRFGPENSRVTMDFDTARSLELDEYVKFLRERLAEGWADFTGEVLIRKQGSPKGVPFEYLMQPLDVKLAYRNHPWCTVRLEVSHNELGDADIRDIRELPIEIKNIFADLGFPEPKPIPLMSIPFQVSQKLHGVTQPGSSRVRDLIDLQLIMNNEKFDIGVTADICRNLFNYRKMHMWPTYVVKGEGWDSVYVEQRGDLSVAETCDEAVRIVNGLIDQLDMA